MEKNTREIGNDNPLRIMLDASFKDSKDYFFWLFVVRIMVLRKLKESATGNIFFQE